MDNYNVCLIDDHVIPENITGIDDTKLIVGDKLSEFSDADSYNWSEPSMKKFVKNLFFRSQRHKRIKISGFKRPEFYLNAIQDTSYNKPEVIVFDWDYGSENSETLLYDLLKETPTKVCILTGNERIEEVEKVIDNEKFVTFRGELSTFEKTAYEESTLSSDKLIDEIFDEYFNTNIKVKYRDKKIIFYPSPFIPNFSDFWKFEAIIGSDNLIRYLGEVDYEISEKTLIGIVDKRNLKFYKDKEGKRIFSYSSQLFRDQFGELEEIKGISAFREYGLDILEESIEKGYSKLN